MSLDGNNTGFVVTLNIFVELESCGEDCSMARRAHIINTRMITRVSVERYSISNYVSMNELSSTINCVYTPDKLSTLSDPIDETI